MQVVEWFQEFIDVWTSWAQHLTALAIAGVCYFKGRDWKPGAALTVYFTMYVLMTIFLMKVDLWHRETFLGFSIVIDWIFMYIFMCMSRVCTIVLATSILWTGVVFISVIKGGDWLYRMNPTVAITISVLLVIGVIIDGWGNRLSVHRDRGDVHI